MNIEKRKRFCSFCCCYYYYCYFRKYEKIEKKREDERKAKEGYLKIEGEEDDFDIGIIGDDANDSFENIDGTSDQNNPKNNFHLICQSPYSDPSLVSRINTIDLFYYELNPNLYSGDLKRSVLDGDKEWWSFLHSLLLVHFIYLIFFSFFPFI
jgi:hypothetical protein